MTLNGNLILYACVARGTTILAEFNSKDGHLGELAAKCLHNTPPLHSLFSHTTRNKTYSFLIHHPFVYFGIFDQNFDKSRGLSFLNALKTSFDDIFALNPPRQLDHHCFQGEFNPVFHQLIASPSGSGHLVSSPRGQMIGSNSLLRKEDRLMRLSKKNKSLLGGSGSGSKENNLDVSDDDLKREFIVPNHKNNGSFSGNMGGGGGGATDQEGEESLEETSLGGVVARPHCLFNLVCYVVVDLQWFQMCSFLNWPNGISMPFLFRIDR